MQWSTKSFLEAVHPEDRKALADWTSRHRATAEAGHTEFRVLWPDGTVHWVESYGNVICDKSDKPVRSVGVLMDITQRKLASAALERANRALKTLSAGNQELVRATSESGLLHAICGVIVEHGGYRSASVAYAGDDPAKSIIPMATVQADQEYFNDNLKRTWDNTAEGQSAIARAIRTGKPAIDRHTPEGAAVPKDGVLVASPSGILDIALPLVDGTRIIGALSIRADDSDAFDQAETKLLEELATDLAYGITTLRIRAERDNISREHEQHAEILRRGLEESIQAIAATVEVRDPYTSGH
jgi:transcriptional regulator with GAF, ATPase, and Fis domain